MSEEYISRKSVRDAIASLSIERFELSNAYRLYVEALDNVDKKVVKIPAADVELVRHGRWIEFPEVLAIDDTLENGYIGCSVCKDVWNMRDNDTERYDYCPNCGARMDGGKNV